MISAFGHFRSFREFNDSPCVEINFTNTGNFDAFYQLTTCNGNAIYMDLAGGETSINYCAMDQSWVVDPGIEVNVVRFCTGDDDVSSSPSPSPAPAPAPSPSPSPSPTPSPSPSPTPNPKEIF